MSVRRTMEKCSAIRRMRNQLGFCPEALSEPTGYSMNDK